MNSYFFKYNLKKELEVIDENGKIIATGDTIYRIFDIMSNELIKKIFVKDNDIMICYDNVITTFIDYPKISADPRYSFIGDYISPFVANQTIENNAKARKIVAEAKANMLNDNEDVRPKKKHSFLKKMSITGVIVGSLIGTALLANDYYSVDSAKYPVATNSAEISVLGGNRANDFVANRYSQITKKYAKKFGIDGELVLAILTNNIEDSSQYVDENHYGAIISEFDTYINQELSYYDFETENWSNYRVTEEDMLDSDRLVKVIFMILQSKIYFCNYNVVAGVQCMHEEIYDFKERIMIDGIERHPDFAEKPFFDKEYFNYAMSDTNDISWIGNFKSPDGSIYAIKVLKHIPSGTNLQIKHPNGEITNYRLNIDYSRGIVLR